MAQDMAQDMAPDIAKDKLIFQTKKTIISIDYANCRAALADTNEPECGFACVKACRLYGRNILKIENNRPVLAVSDPAEIKRLDNECLACEYHCADKGPGCISIEVELNL